MRFPVAVCVSVCIRVGIFVALLCIVFAVVGCVRPYSSCGDEIIVSHGELQFHEHSSCVYACMILSFPLCVYVRERERRRARARKSLMPNCRVLAVLML